MLKQNTTQNLSFYIIIEKTIRLIPIIYIIFRSLVRFTNYFENDFFYLKNIFKNKKINIIDVGASDGISALFFLRNLNPNKIYCYEPQIIYFKKLIKLKKKYKNILPFNYGLAEKNSIMKIFYPYINLFGKKISLLTYSFPVKNELEKQIKLDFLIKPRIEKSQIKVKRFKLVKSKIDLIKIDTNGSEVGIVKTLLPVIKRDKPVLIIENNNISIIFKILKKLKYKKYYLKNNVLKAHNNQNNANIIFK
tara:strand:- start:1328 stop:2074 length:747 start_codon:yes stop_codon:yes gene_type:complete